MDIVCYPKTFLDRPEDRVMLSELAEAGVDPDSAKLILYRLWAEFAMGGSERRVMGSDSNSIRRSVRSIEDYVGWKGTQSALVEMAVSVGFLKRDTASGVEVLICSGFKECNAGKGRSVQSAGGRATALKKHLVGAESGAAERLELWSRTKPRGLDGIPAELRKDGVVLMLRVCRVLSMKDPGDAALVDGTLRSVVRVLEEYTPDQIEQVIAWFYLNRNDESVPDRLDAVFLKWSEFVAASAAANG